MNIRSELRTIAIIIMVSFLMSCGARNLTSFTDEYLKSNPETVSHLAFIDLQHNYGGCWWKSQYVNDESAASICQIMPGLSEISGRVGCSSTLDWSSSVGNVRPSKYNFEKGKYYTIQTDSAGVSLMIRNIPKEEFEKLQ